MRIPSQTAQLAISSVLLWATALLAGASASAAGLIPDGGFETATGDVPVGWTRHATLGGRVQIATGKEHVHGGGKAVRLTPKPEPQNASTVLFSDRVKVERGKRYRASVWVKGKGSFSLSFYQYSPKRAWLRGGVNAT